MKRRSKGFARSSAGEFMRVLNFGSLNIDHVYSVDSFVRPGETISCDDYRQFGGGKGSNQSIALVYAGADVFHAGKLGRDGVWLKDSLDRSGVDTSFIKVTDGPSGHAVIQVNKDGENSIVIHDGANGTITKDDIEKVLPNFSSGDCLLLQNEISSIPEIMNKGAELGLNIVFNPAPMDDQIAGYPLDLVKFFILNEIEGGDITGEKEPDRILSAMLEKFPNTSTVLTLGDRGAMYRDKDRNASVSAEKVNVVDTTAAEDTFVGYFVAGIVGEEDVETALETACRAAAVCVTRPGAADSIPRREEIA